MQVWTTRQSCHTGRGFPGKKSGNAVGSVRLANSRDSSDGNAWFLRDSRPTRVRQYLYSTLGAKKRVARRSLSVQITPTAGVVAEYRRPSRRAGVVELPAQCRGDEKSPSSKFDTPAALWEKKMEQVV